MPAGVTLGEVAAEGLGAADTDICRCPPMAWQHGVAKAVKIMVTVATENVCYLCHGR